VHRVEAADPGVSRIQTWNYVTSCKHYMGCHWCTQRFNDMMQIKGLMMTSKRSKHVA